MASLKDDIYKWRVYLLVQTLVFRSEMREERADICILVRWPREISRETAAGEADGPFRDTCRAADRCDIRASGDVNFTIAPKRVWLTRRGTKVGK